MYFYFAQFYYEGDGGYSIFFPDLPGCLSCGDSLDEAMDMAMDALTTHLEGMLYDNDPIPKPSDYKTAKEKSEAYYKEIGLEPNPDTLYLLVPALPQRDCMCRLTLVMDQGMADELCRQADELELSPPELALQAVRDYLESH